MIPWFLLAMAAGEIPLPAPVPDPVLAEERGGFSLPGGLDVALSVQTQTAIDGRVVLATVFKAVDTAPQFSAFVPRGGETVTSQIARANETAASEAMPSVVIDARSGVRIVPGAVAPNVSVAGGSSALPEGLIAATAGVSTDAGMIATETSGDLRTIELKGADLSVTHFAGAAFGSAIANSASDRAIDTVTTVGIDLRNAGPANLGSTMFRVDDLALNALMGRVN